LTADDATELRKLYTRGGASASASVTILSDKRVGIPGARFGGASLNLLLDLYYFYDDHSTRSYSFQIIFGLNEAYRQEE